MEIGHIDGKIYISTYPGRKKNNHLERLATIQTPFATQRGSFQNI